MRVFYHKAMPHIHDKIDFTVGVFVVHKDRVLLRMHDKYKIWCDVGGHIELDEDPNQAAIREVKEEVGLDVKLVDVDYEKRKWVMKDERELIPPRFLHRHNTGPTHEHVDLIYFATSETMEIIQGDREISEGIKWFNEKELDDPQYGLDPNIKYYAHAALKVVAAEIIKTS
jgi:ADP-ribose pyrophosphatase YjhB (NUDIX family)